MIEVVGLRKSFNGQDVLKGVDFTVGKGEVFTVIGKSGEGKSVLLKHLLALLRPDAGHVYIDGVDITKLHGPPLYKVRDRIGYLFQGGALFDSMSVFDNVAFPLREKTKLKAREVRERVMDELEKLGLSGMEDKYPSDVSGGMKKRAAFARAMVMRPEIVLFDEPTTGLDPVLVNSVHRLIAWGRETYSYTAVVVSHEIPEILDISDRVGMLAGGALVAVGTADEIKNSDVPAVRRFIRGEPEEGHNGIGRHDGR